jgi:hypothetical protein
MHWPPQALYPLLHCTEHVPPTPEQTLVPWPPDGGAQLLGALQQVAFPTQVPAQL